MRSRNTSIFKPIIAVLTVTMLVVALACASDDANAYQSSGHVSAAHCHVGVSAGRAAAHGDSGGCD